MFLGLRTAIYQVPDLVAARAWYAEAFGVQPYFDQPFYVGFDVGGYELGLVPAGQAVSDAGGVVAYWGVPAIDDAVAHMVQRGARVVAEAKDVGEGIKVATVADPFGNPIGIIENPHFAVKG